jgi:hypothetical protein
VARHRRVDAAEEERWSRWEKIPAVVEIRVGGVRRVWRGVSRDEEEEEGEPRETRKRVEAAVVDTAAAIIMVPNKYQRVCARHE